VVVPEVEAVVVPVVEPDVVCNQMPCR
jgi:hypothetical protein